MQIAEEPRVPPADPTREEGLHQLKEHNRAPVGSTRDNKLRQAQGALAAKIRSRGAELGFRGREGGSGTPPPPPQEGRGVTKFCYAPQVKGKITRSPNC